MKAKDFETELNRVLDRTHDVRALAGRVADSWRYDLKTRRLGAAYQGPDGTYQTDLDLAVYLSALAERRSVIALQSYRGRRAATRTEGEVVIDRANRHGRIIELKSNQKVFSFNVVVEDANVITTSDVGRPRTFMLQDLDGTWHDGWRTIQVMPQTDEERRLFEGTDGSVNFQHFIHPNRWTSPYSRPYALALATIERIADQDRFLKAEQRRLRDELGIAPKEWPKSEKVGDDKPIKVWAFETKIDMPDFRGDYEPYPATQGAYEEIGMLRHRLRQLITQLRFNARASDYAFWTQAVVPQIGKETEAVLGWLRAGDPEDIRIPTWAQARFLPGFKETDKAKTYWAAMERPEGVMVRWRAFRKTERVAADS